MPSIFIWKSDEPNTSTKTIRYYSGSNWVLEDNDYSSKSYIYLEQIVISESDNSVITFHIKDMPQDWVGSDLLEVSYIPYEMIKSDKYGTLEKIGDWMRFTTIDEIKFNIEFLKLEIIRIKKWTNEKVNEKVNDKKVHRFQKIEKQENKISFDPHTIQQNFKNFLNMYNIPSNNTPITGKNYKNDYKMINTSNMNKNNENVNVNTSKMKYHKNSYNTKYIEAK